MSKQENNTRVMLTNVRLAFPHLFEPQPSQDGGKPKYNGTLIFAPDSANVKKVKRAIEQAAEVKWGKKAEVILKTLRKKDRTCLHDGDDKAKYDGFEGMLYVSASTDVRPTVVDADKTPLAASDGRPYSGCFVNASLDIWAQDNNYGQRVNAQLRGVQFYKDGDAFGAGRPADADEFDDVSGEDDDVSGEDDDELF